MSAFRTKLSIIKGRPDITPMIDVVFLLLLFFLISSSFVQITGVEIRVPEAVNPQDIRAEKVVITIEEENSYLFNDQRYDWVTLKDQLNSFTTRWKVDSVVILADKRISYGEVIKVISLANSLNLNAYAVTKSLKEKQADED